MITTFPILATLQTLYCMDETVELRIVGSGPPLNGFFRDWDKLLQAAEALNAERNVYICLNPALPDLYARCPDDIQRTDRGGAVKDDQVVCRRWLLIDVDPDRPSGVSATDQQKQAAENLAAEIYRWLSAQLGSEAVCTIGIGLSDLLR